MWRAMLPRHFILKISGIITIWHVINFRWFRGKRFEFQAQQRWAVESWLVQPHWIPSIPVISPWFPSYLLSLPFDLSLAIWIRHFYRNNNWKSKFYATLCWQQDERWERRDVLLSPINVTRWKKLMKKWIFGDYWRPVLSHGSTQRHQVFARLEGSPLRDFWALFGPPFWEASRQALLNIPPTPLEQRWWLLCKRVIFCPALEQNGREASYWSQKSRGEERTLTLTLRRGERMPLVCREFREIETVL